MGLTEVRFFVSGEYQPIQTGYCPVPSLDEVLRLEDGNLYHVLDVEHRPRVSAVNVYVARFQK